MSLAPMHCRRLPISRNEAKHRSLGGTSNGRGTRTSADRGTNRLDLRPLSPHRRRSRRHAAGPFLTAKQSIGSQRIGIASRQMAANKPARRRASCGCAFRRTTQACLRNCRGVAKPVSDSPARTSPLSSVTRAIVSPSESKNSTSYPSPPL